MEKKTIRYECNDLFTAIAKAVNEDNCKFYLVCNLEDNKIYLVHGYKRKSDRVITSFDFKEVEEGTRLSTVRKEVRQAIADYRHDTNRTKSTIVKEYGKKALYPQAFTTEAPNPYYSSSSPMQLYNEEVVEYYENQAKKKRG